MRTIKRKLFSLLILFTLCAALSVCVYAASGTVLWSAIDGKKAVLYLPTQGEVTECQIGTAKANGVSAREISKLEHPIETLILIDNSLSIPKDERPIVLQILENLIGNRMQGELFTIATISDDINYLCAHESDYLSLGSVINGITYQNQDTQLTDNLYRALSAQQNESPLQFTRVVIVSDGVDDKEIGYTRAELEGLIRSCGYPIYTIGCGKNDTTERKTKLENLFAFSRINAGQSFYLGDNTDTFAIAKSICEYNEAMRVIIPLRDELCDGSTRAVKLTSGGQEYSVQLTMPFSVIAESKPASSTAASEPSSQPQPEETTSFFSKHIVLIAAIGGGVVLAVALAITLAIVMRKRKAKAKTKPTPEPNPQKSTAVVIDPSNHPEAGGNFKHWWPTEDDTPQSRDNGEATFVAFPKKEASVPPVQNGRHILRLVDTADTFRTFEVPVEGKIYIGRDAACRVVIDDSTVSHRQCEVSVHEGNVYITNCSATNPTQVDGKRIEQPTPLHSGSIIKMGRIKMKVVIT